MKKIVIQPVLTKKGRKLLDLDNPNRIKLTDLILEDWERMEKEPVNNSLPLDRVINAYLKFFNI